MSIPAMRRRLESALDRLGGNGGPCRNPVPSIILPREGRGPAEDIPPGTPRCPNCNQVHPLYVQEIVINSRQDLAEVEALNNG